MRTKIGWIVIIIGSLHSLLAMVKFSESFGSMLSEGIFNTGTGPERGWAIWFTFCGILFILLGLGLKFIENKGLNIPKSMGWGLAGSAILGGLILPASGFWALLLPALLILSNKKGT